MRDLLLAASGSFAHGYHIELGFDDVEVARDFSEELAGRDIFAHLCGGNNSPHTPLTRVYIKDSESICNLLAIVGATKSLCELNNQIVERSARNVSNRRTNCDSANIARSVATAANQVEELKQIMKSTHFKTLPPELQDTARARIKNPDASYVELAAILGITKSGVLHRLGRLRKFNDEISRRK